MFVGRFMRLFPSVARKIFMISHFVYYVVFFPGCQLLHVVHIFQKRAAVIWSCLLPLPGGNNNACSVLTTKWHDKW